MYHDDIIMTNILGKIERNESGHIIRAQAASMLFLISDQDDWRDEAMEWESEAIRLTLDRNIFLKKKYIYTSRRLVHSSNLSPIIVKCLILYFA